MVPRDASGVLIVDQGHHLAMLDRGDLTVVPPEVAYQLIATLKAQLDVAMRAGPQALSPGTPSDGGKANGQQGGSDGTKK
jgi:hypothetical protein